VPEVPLEPAVPELPAEPAVPEVAAKYWVPFIDKEPVISTLPVNC
jgi:hypothetical protein